jgi:hypothetical protein
VTAPKRPAIERAAEQILAVRADWTPFTPPPTTELNAVDVDVLQEYLDERRMAMSTPPGSFRTPEALAAMASHADEVRERFKRKGWTDGSR